MCCVAIRGIANHIVWQQKIIKLGIEEWRLRRYRRGAEPV